MLMWLCFFSLYAQKPEWGGWDSKESKHAVCAEKSLKEFFFLEDRCAYFSKHWPVFWFGLFFFPPVWVCFKSISQKLSWTKKNTAAYILNYRQTYPLFFKWKAYMQDVVVVVQMIILFAVCCYQTHSSSLFLGRLKEFNNFFVLCPCLTDSEWLFCKHSVIMLILTFSVSWSDQHWIPLWSSSHFCLFLTKPSTALQCYWTNQPYQWFESWALPNYNLSGSQDADECGGITVQSHTRHWHPASDSSTRPPNPAPRISLRCRWSWFQVSSFVFLHWLKYRPQLSLPLSLSLLIKTDPQAGHTKAKLIIPEIGYMSILWW